MISTRSVGLDSSSSDRSGDKDPFTVFRLEVFEPDLRSMARIVVRPIGSPMPLGFFTVAIETAPGSAT
jgi:hypothetical protein